MNTRTDPHRNVQLLWSIKDIVTQAVRAWVEHDGSTMGAALAFYTVFSVAPILIIAIGVIGLAVGVETVRAELLPQMQTLFGNAGATAVQTLLSSANYLGKSRMATVVGSVVLLLGASSVFVELQNSLDRIWGIPKRNRDRNVWRIFRTRFLSLGLVLGVGFLLMVSLLGSALLAALGDWLGSFLGQWRILIFVVGLASSFGISTVLFALVYKYVPQERLQWNDVWVGGVVTAIFFNIGKFGIGYYLGKSAFASVYGAAGSLLVFFLWAFYSAQVFLFGAELTKSYSYILGARVARPPSPPPESN
jgi:membrane protein